MICAIAEVACPGEAETLAWGQVAVWTGFARCPTISATMYAPRGVWLDDERLMVCDSGNHRVLIWNSIPTEDQAAG